MGEFEPAIGAYYREAGFEVLEQAGLDTPFQDVIKLPQPVVDAFVRERIERNRSADAILLIGPAWRTMGLVAQWETEFGIPVVHHVQAQSWEMQRLLGLHHPVEGWGRLVRELPALP